MTAAAPVPPMVMWAQRPNLIFLTVCLEDCKDPEIKVDADKLAFKGIGGPEKKNYELTINFFKEVDTEKSKYAVRGRNIEFALEKKESGPYWKRLCNEEKKQHWLKIDFNKWKDEDESDDEAGGGQDLEQLQWNSLMESVRHNSQESNPVELFAAQNDAIQSEVLKATNAKNANLEKNLGRKKWELENKKAFLEEQLQRNRTA